MAEEAKDGPAETGKEEKDDGSVEEKAAEKSVEELVAAAKAKGNEAYKRSEFEEAVKSYSEAIALCTTDASLYSNRSAAYGSKDAYAEALEDAQACIRLRPEWPKGYARQGYAQFHLGRFEDSRQSYSDGLKQDPTSDALKDGLKDVEAAIAKAKQAAQAAQAPSSKRTKRQGFKGQLSKLVNPLGLSTKGAILYAITVITVIGFFVIFRAARSGRGPKSPGAGGAESNAEL